GCEDEEVRIGPGPGGGFDFEDHVVGGDDVFISEMAAALGHDLVFEQNAGGAGCLEGFDGALDVVQIALAGVAISNDGNGDAGGHAANGFGHLCHGDEIQIGQAEHGGAGAETADEDGLKSGAFDDQSGEDVV